MGKHAPLSVILVAPALWATPGKAPSSPAHFQAGDTRATVRG